MTGVLHTGKALTGMILASLTDALVYYVAHPMVGMGAMFLLPGVMPMLSGRSYAGSAWVTLFGIARQ